MKTMHIQKMVRTALAVAEAADEDSDHQQPGIREMEGAVNKLRHAACELEAEILEHWYRVPQD
jgi:hypothetical protein